MFGGNEIIAGSNAVVKPVAPAVNFDVALENSWKKHQPIAVGVELKCGDDRKTQVDAQNLALEGVVTNDILPLFGNSVVWTKLEVTDIEVTNQYLLTDEQILRLRPLIEVNFPKGQGILFYAEGGGWSTWIEFDNPDERMNGIDKNWKLTPATRDKIKKGAEDSIKTAIRTGKALGHELTAETAGQDAANAYITPNDFRDRVKRLDSILKSRGAEALSEELDQFESALTLAHVIEKIEAKDLGAVKQKILPRGNRFLKMLFDKRNSALPTKSEPKKEDKIDKKKNG